MNQNVFEMLQWEKQELRKKTKKKEYQMKHFKKRKERFREVKKND